MSRPTKATIDLQALSHNLQVVKGFAPNSKILAMIKADAYGHGLLRVAEGLQGADAFGVACSEEALACRNAGIRTPIVLMEGPLTADEIPLSQQHDFHLVVHHPSQIDMLKAAVIKKPIEVWLKIETGMHRLGFLPYKFKQAYQWCLENPERIKAIHFMTHFAEAEAADPSRTQKQLEEFLCITKGLPGQRSLANSAGIIGWPTAHADWVRPGIMLYGISPIPGKIGNDYNLKPVMQFKSQLIAVKDCQAGDRVGYGGTWTAGKAMKLGVVAVGYGDGYPRHIPNGAPVVVAGHVLPIVGRISMDMLTVDCSNYPTAKIGDDVELWGSQLPVERVAAAADTIAYECVTQVTGRVERLVC